MDDDDGHSFDTSCIDADLSINRVRSGRRKDRKIRTTVTKEMLEKMNTIFSDYYQRRESGKELSINLKEILIAQCHG